MDDESNWLKFCIESIWDVYRNDRIIVSAYIYIWTWSRKRVSPRTAACTLWFKRSHWRSSLIACNLIHTLPIKRLPNERFVIGLHCNTCTSRHKTEESTFYCVFHNKLLLYCIVVNECTRAFCRSVFQRIPTPSQKLSKKRQEMKTNVKNWPTESLFVVYSPIYQRQFAKKCSR